MKKDEENKKLRNLNLAFFLVVSHNHYYVIVFNFEKENTAILDNSICDADYKGKYKAVFDFVVRNA